MSLTYHSWSTSLAFFHHRLLLEAFLFLAKDNLYKNGLIHLLKIIFI